MIYAMNESSIDALKAQRHEIHRRWEALLRLDRADGPLAEPDNLVHLIDWTITEVLDELQRRRTARPGEPPPAIASLRAGCRCGHNPLFNHFAAGEQAMLEALIQLQAGDPSLLPHHRSTTVVELYVAIHAIAKREFELLCSLCAKRPKPRTHAQLAMAALSS
jgi:hypothetical protein